jgi:hypothetical protein
MRSFPWPILGLVCVGIAMLGRANDSESLLLAGILGWGIVMLINLAVRK